MALTRAQIQTAFQNSLGRAASANDENSFFSVSQSGALTDAQVYSTISNSQEANLNADPVVRFYQAAFGRVPDQAGLDNATDYVRSFGASAATYQNLSNMFAQSQEFTNRFGTGTAVDAAYVQALYSTILGRQASAGEIDAFTSGANGYTTRGGVLYAISQSGEAQTASNNAVNGFLNNAAQGTAVYSGTLYTTANGQADAPGAGSQTFTLTSNIDNLVGGAGNDLFIGTDATFSTGDSINGGAGNDTARVIASNTFNAIPTLNGVERVEVQSFGSTVINTVNTPNTGTVNLSNSTGVTTVATANGNANVTFTGLKAIVAAEATNVTGGNLTLAYNTDVVSGTADVQALSLNSAVLGTVDVSGTETVNITATGTNSITALTDTSLKTVSVTGAGNLTIGSGITGTATFNGTAATGNLTATFGAGSSTVTGGSGNDKFIFGTELGLGDTVVGGTGTDTVTITGQVLTTGETLTALNSRVTGVEVLEFNGTPGATITGGTGAGAFTNTEITKLLFNTTGADTINNAGSARTYAFGELNDGLATLNLANTTAVNVSLEGIVGNGGDVNGLTVVADPNGVVGATSTVNIASIGTGTTANTTGTITATAGSTINVTGSHDLTIGGLANGGSVNASGFTGKLTVTGSGANDSITVGSGGSVVTGGNGGDQITFGSGVDTSNYTAGNQSGVFTAAVIDDPATTTVNEAAPRTITQLDNITGFTAGAGGDHLSVAGGTNTYTALTAAQQTAINNTTTNATLADAIDAAALAHTANGWTAFTYSGSTYALHEATGANTTYDATANVVKLAGVDVTTLTTANFGPVTA